MTDYLIGTIHWAGEFEGRPAIALSAYNLGTIWSYHCDKGWALDVRKDCLADIMNFLAGKNLALFLERKINSEWAMGPNAEKITQWLMEFEKNETKNDGK